MSTVFKKPNTWFLEEYNHSELIKKSENNSSTRNRESKAVVSGSEGRRQLQEDGMPRTKNEISLSKINTKKILMLLVIRIPVIT